MASSLPKPADALYQRFDDAIEYFRSKSTLTREEWDALDDDAKKRAFMVSGVADVDVVTQVWESLGRAIELGTPFEEWKAEAGPALERAWGGTIGNTGWRLETIFRTNAQTAFQAGRFKQATDSDVAKLRPFWRFDAIMDSRTSDICHKRSGTTLPNDAAWWRSNYPPLHHACRSTVITLRAAQAEKLGITAKPPEADPPGEGFGTFPTLDGWAPKSSDYPKPLRSALPAE